VRRKANRELDKCLDPVVDDLLCSSWVVHMVRGGCKFLPAVGRPGLLGTEGGEEVANRKRLS
jgi:hypothetical protein